MKRAVSSIDATARGPPNTPQKLKRCKSAFANLKRLGGAVTASPTTPPLSGRCSGDPGGIGWAVGEEISLPPCWRQHASPTDVNVKASSSAAAPPIRTFAPGSRCSDVSFPYHGPTSSAFYPQRGTTGLRGAGRRLFGISDADGQEHSHTTKTQGMMLAENDSFRGGRSSRTMGPRINSSFTSTFKFSPVPEDEVSTTSDEVESTHCPFLHLHRRQDSVIGARVTTTVSSIDIDGGSGRESPTGSDRCMEESDDCDRWTDPGSPVFSIVGFDGAEDEEREGGDARDGVVYSVASSASPTVERLQATRSLGSASCLEGNGQANSLVPDSRHAAAAAAAVESWSPSRTADTSNHSVNGSSSSSSNNNISSNSTPSSSSGSPISPILLLRLQRRFEEMLLISNVAT